ncbi:TIGR02285 family protein [Pseudoduganella sp. FT93W]|uniref:TIGR02285 family protein n=1 Tax=Duganella fentianensis TaxID=2692177 RepID=A0A845I1K2_9BURK|nr:TIGR02285 family protein [Duganella fentianensis]MYN47464.1 TIGR02285 family protein [Duganella fentianensis]
MLLASALASSAALAQAAASGQPGVIWLSSYFPPVNVPVEGKPGDGIADRITEYVVAHWPEARHQFVRANPTRIWHMLGQDASMCDTAALRTPEREKLAYFRAVFFSPPPQLIIRPEALEHVRLNELGQVDPAELMNNPELRGVIIKQRAYGPAVDQVLRQPGVHLNVEQLASPNYGAGTLKMLLLGRADYLIEYDITLAYAITQDAALARLKVLPLKGAENFVVTGFACPRTPWGLATIRRIDAILSTPEAAALIVRTELGALTPASVARYGAQIRESVRRASVADAERFR